MDRSPQKLPTLPYARQSVSAEDIEAVVQVMQSDWLTTGPMVERFERALADRVAAEHAVAVSSGTAALHAAMFALRIQAGDEVIVPTTTFVATANAVVFQGGTPVFADVDPHRLLIDTSHVESLVTNRTKAVIAVDFAGQPCDYEALHGITDAHGLSLVADACHSLGASFSGRCAGTLARLNAFSFHPVKPITSAEGGMVTTDDPLLAERMRRFRNHGITTDFRQRDAAKTWSYEMRELGYNLRLSDVHCALGLSQLKRLDEFTNRRRQLAKRYDRALCGTDFVEPLEVDRRAASAYHLYVVRWHGQESPSRDEAFQRLRSAGLAVNVHYTPVHLHPYYRERFGTGPGMCPVAERAGREILSLPLFPDMADADVDRVVSTLYDVAGQSRHRSAA